MFYIAVISPLPTILVSRFYTLGRSGRTACLWSTYTHRRMFYIAVISPLPTILVSRFYTLGRSGRTACRWSTYTRRRMFYIAVISPLPTILVSRFYTLGRLGRTACRWSTYSPYRKIDTVLAGVHEQSTRTVAARGTCFAHVGEVFIMITFFPGSTVVFKSWTHLSKSSQNCDLYLPAASALPTPASTSSFLKWTTHRNSVTV